MAFNVEGLSQYVSENKDIILKDIVFGETYGDTIPLMAKQLGIKTSEKIHPTTIDATLQDVNGCGFEAEGGLSFSERTIATHQKKVNLEFCLEDLKGKFAEYTLRIGANQDALPFEGEIVEGKFHGRGKMRWANGMEYDGEWRAGEKHGEGKEIFFIQ